MTRLLGTITLLVLIAGAVFYAAGWIKFERSPDRTLIEIESQRIEEATRDAVEQGRQTIEETFDNISPDSGGDADSNSSPPPTGE